MDNHRVAIRDWESSRIFAIICVAGTDEEIVMKLFQCTVPGCDWHTRHDNEAEIIRRATEHLRETHGEETIRESTVEAIRARIETDKAAAA